MGVKIWSTDDLIGQKLHWVQWNMGIYQDPSPVKV